MCIGDRIKQVRLENGLTQAEFSKTICISQPHLSAVEHCKETPSKAVIKVISLSFNVTESWLVNG